MDCVNAAFHASHQSNIVSKFDPSTENTGLWNPVCNVCTGVCHPIVWKTSLPRKRSLPSSTRFRECFHLSCVTTGVCHPLTDLFRSLPPYHFSMYSSLPRGACRPLHVVIYVVHGLFQTLTILVIRHSHRIVFVFSIFLLRSFRPSDVFS